MTLDPRGYGDSTISSELNETSVVKDAVMAMRYTFSDTSRNIPFFLEKIKASSSTYSIQTLSSTFVETDSLGKSWEMK